MLPYFAQTESLKEQLINSSTHRQQQTTKLQLTTLIPHFPRAWSMKSTPLYISNPIALAACRKASQARGLSHHHLLALLLLPQTNDRAHHWSETLETVVNQDIKVLVRLPDFRQVESF
jgi:hypothetical protein